MFKVDFCLQIINNAVMKQPKKANICMDTVPSYKVISVIHLKPVLLLIHLIFITMFVSTDHLWSQWL